MMRSGLEPSALAHAIACRKLDIVYATRGLFRDNEYHDALGVHVNGVLGVGAVTENDNSRLAVHFGYEIGGLLHLRSGCIRLFGGVPRKPRAVEVESRVLHRLLNRVDEAVENQRQVSLYRIGDDEDREIQRRCCRRSRRGTANLIAR